MGLILNSCTIRKRTYMPGYYVHFNSKKHSTNEHESKLIVTDTASSDITTSSSDVIIPVKEYIVDEPCDLIILKSGDEISGRVTELGLTEIKYKKCDNLNGPTVTIRKEDVFIIKYANGTKDNFSNSDKNTNTTKTPINKDEQPLATKDNKLRDADYPNSKTSIFAIIGFVLAVIGFIVSLVFFEIGIPLAIIAIVLSAIGKGQIRKNPDKYKGRGFAGWGITIGILTLVVSLVLIALLLLLL